MCLKNSHLLEWLCLHQLSRRLWLPVSLWALLLWWLSPWRRTEAQWAGVDPERRQVLCLFLQGKTGRMHWKLWLCLSLPFLSPHHRFLSFWLSTHESLTFQEGLSILIWANWQLANRKLALFTLVCFVVVVVSGLQYWEETKYQEKLGRVVKSGFCTESHSVLVVGQVPVCINQHSILIQARSLSRTLTHCLPFCGNIIQKREAHRPFM